MRPQRSRVAVIGAMSAAFLIGMPAAGALAAPADPPAQNQDPTPPPSEDPDAPPPATEDDSVVELPILPDPDGDGGGTGNTPEDSDTGPAPERSDDDNDLLFTTSQAAEPVTDTVEPVVDLTEDTAPAAQQESDPELPQTPDNDGGQGAQGGGAQGGAGGAATAEAESGNPAPTGELGRQNRSDDGARAEGGIPRQARGPQCTDNADFGCVSADGAARSQAAGPGDSTQPASGQATSAQATSTSTSGGGALPDTGADAAKVAGAGLGLILGGLVLRGTGRHRRNRARSAGIF